MCGRYSLITPVEALRQLFGVLELPNLAPRYNVAPTQEMPVVRPRAGEARGRELVAMRWGLVPEWADGPAIGGRMINARAETVAEKPSFRAAFRARRCLVPADGFYEWVKDDEARQPYRIALEGETPFAFAGLWENWQPPTGQDAKPLQTFTIVTTEANDRLRPIHPRMPVILDPADYETWLTGDPNAAQALLRPYPDAAMRAYQVSARVNSTRYDDAACLAPLENPAPASAQLRLL
jgi:putative SOS response-associated peptidase YedK